MFFYFVVNFYLFQMLKHFALLHDQNFPLTFDQSQRSMMPLLTGTLLRSYMSSLLFFFSSLYLECMFVCAKQAGYMNNSYIQKAGDISQPICLGISAKFLAEHLEPLS